MTILNISENKPINIFDFAPGTAAKAEKPVKVSRVAPAMPVTGEAGTFTRFNAPTNPVTGQEYKGAQAVLLASLQTCNQFAGFAQWLSVGRSVIKGQKGIQILMPFNGQDKEGNPKTSFKRCYVFAIEQTEIVTEKAGA